jgi:hypothetical protein
MVGALGVAARGECARLMACERERGAKSPFRLTLPGFRVAVSLAHSFRPGQGGTPISLTPRVRRMIAPLSIPHWR